MTFAPLPRKRKRESEDESALTDVVRTDRLHDMYNRLQVLVGVVHDIHNRLQVVEGRLQALVGVVQQMVTVLSKVNSLNGLGE